MSLPTPGRRTLPLLAALLLAACTPPAPRTPPPAADADGALVSSLRVETGDTVRFTLQVTNPSAAPVVFTFPTGQTYDFAVRPAAGGALAWRWSEQTVFTQAVRTRTLAPGETWTFGERWTPPPGTRGQFTAVATLASSDRPIERTAGFRLP